MKDGLPPGPRAALVQSMAYMRDPYAFYARLRRTYGDPITVPTLNGTVVVTGSPDGLKQIFAARPDTFDVFGTQSLTPILGPRSLLVMSGPPHLERRKLMMPPFHGEKMHAFGHQFREIARRHAQRIPEGRRFAMQDLACQITLDAIVRCVFGIKEGATERPFAHALNAVMDEAHPLGIFFPFLRTRLLPPWRRFLDARAHADALIFAELSSRRAAPKDDAEDILGMLLAARFEDGASLSDEELRDQLFTLLVAGHETTSSALAWSFYWLYRHPEVRERVLEEISALGPEPDPRTIAKLPYLEAVCHEALRLNPIVPDVVRTARKPFELLGHRLPPGMGVAASTVLAHSDPDVFPEPETFRPERFLGRMPSSFMPFGGGIRRCIGAAFALYEMKIVLATLLVEHSWARWDDRDVPASRRNITVGPRGGVAMVRVGRTPQEKKKTAA